jgi:hypothetical protein
VTHDRNHIFSGLWSIGQKTDPVPGSVQYKFVSDSAGVAALSSVTGSTSGRCKDPSDWYVGTFHGGQNDSGPVVGCTSARVTPTAGTRFQLEGYFKSNKFGGVGELDVAIWCQPDGIGPIAASFTSDGKRYPIIFRFLHHFAGDGSTGGSPCEKAEAPPTQDLELVAYPCGLPNGLPQPNQGCAKTGFSVHLVGVLNKGNGSLPSGTVITIEQTPEHSTFALAPTPCTRPPRRSNCLLHFEASNKTGVFAPILGDGAMWYRATLRMGGAGGTILARSDRVRVFWDNQVPDPIVGSKLELEAYLPCNKPRSIRTGTHLNCKAGRQTAHVFTTLSGFGGKPIHDLPDGIEIWVEQSPGSFAATPPSCASPPLTVNCRVLVGFDPPTGGEIAFGGPTPEDMRYRATVREHGGPSVLTSKSMQIGWLS